MSQEVDERVVKLSFDNEKFEQNVKQSIHSLRALNDSLRLDGAEKGFEEVEKASEQVDFDKMQGAVETLSEKFSALEVVGVTALVRITNKVIDTGERLAKSLSIDQVTAGWSKYAEKTASVQTIMNATGKSITKVNRYLDKLMWYSDETSYGFNDMTASLGQLTAAGGDIDKLVPMIMGIANATAYAGKGASEFKRVIYNLNQSYSQGYLNLMDWKSVELAGVATAELKNQLIQTGIELGKIKKGDVTIGTFNSTLSKKWADKDVMETAFGKLAEFSEAVKNAVDEADDPYYQTADAIEDLADQYDEVTVKAFKAAQEAKSFSEVVDATKDAVSTGWMETFDILFGNYDEAKKFWTDLAGEFWTLFAGGADGRNGWLKAGLDSGLDQLLDNTALGDVGDSFTELLQKSLLDSGKLTSEGIEEAGSFQKALQAAGITAQDLYDQVQLSLAVYKEAANLSDKELKSYNVSRSTLEKTIAAYQAMADAIQNGEVNLEEYADQMGRMSGREHFYSGILNILEGINSVLTPIRAAFNEVFMTDGGPLYNLLKGFDELTAKFSLSEETGRNVQKVFKGVFSVLNVGFKTVRTVGRIALALVELLLEKLQPVGDLLLSVGAAFGDVFTNLNDSLNSAESIEDVITAVATAFGRLLQPLKDVFGALKALVMGSSVEEAGSKFGAFGRIVTTVTNLLQNFGLNTERVGGVVGTVVRTVGGIFQSFGNGTITLSGLIGKAVQTLGGIFYLAFDGVRSLLANAFAGFQDAGNEVKDFKDKNLDTLTEVRDTVVSLPEKAGAAMKAFAGNVQSAFYTVADACKTGLSAILKFFHLEDGLDFYRTLSLLVVGALALAIWGVASALKALNKQIENTKKAVTNALKNPVTELLNSMKKAVDAWAAQHTTNNFVNVAKGISIAIGALSAAIYVLSKIEDPMKAAQALGEVIAVLFSLVIAMKALAKEDITGLDSAKIFAAMISFSAGMLAFSASIKGIVQAMKMLKYFSKDQMNNAVGGLLAIGLVIGTMAGLIGGLNYSGNKLMAGSKIKMANIWKGMSCYLVVAAALLEVAGALYLLGNMDESKFMDAFGAMFTMSIVMELMVGTIGALNYSNNKLQAASKNKLRGITEGASSFLVMASALVVVAGAAKLFSTVKSEKLDSTMGAMLGTLTVMAAAITLMSKFGGKAKKMRSGAASMLIIGGALYIVAEALKTMHDAMLYDADGSGWAGLAVNLILLGTAVAILGSHAPESLAAAAAIAALGASMILMAEAIKMLVDVEWTDIGKGLVALCISLLALVGAATWLPAASAGILSVAGSCLMLAAALLILTPAFKGLASLSLQQGAVGIAAMVAMVAAIGAVGSNPAVAAGLVVLSANLILLGKAFSAFAGGLLKLSGALAIFSIFLLFSQSICEIINTSKDDITQALIDIVTIICDVIVACAKPLGYALEAVVKTLILVLLDLIAWAWNGEGLGDEGGGIKGKLGWLFNEIGDYIRTDGKKTIEGAIADLLGGISHLTPGYFMEKFALGLGIRGGAALRTNTQEAAKQAEQDAANASGVAAKNVKDTAAAAQLAAKSTEDYANGMIDIVDSTGKIHKATAEQVKDLQDGEITMDDLLAATDDTAGAMSGLAGRTDGMATAAAGFGNAASGSASAMNGLAAATDETNGKLQNGAATARACGVEAAGSEKVIQETGDKIETDAKDLQNSTDTAMQDAMDSAAEIAGEGGEAAADSFLARWGKKISNWWNSTFGTNLNTDSLVSGANKLQEGVLGTADPKKLVGDAVGGVTNVIGDFTDKAIKDMMPGALEAIRDATPTTDTGNATGTGKTKKTGGSTKKKTAAEVVEEKYKAPLEKNKQLREAEDTGYELWVAENERSATDEERAAKRAEHLQNAIDRQNERVNLAWNKYVELNKLGAQAESEAREAYNDWLSAKKDLADLRNDQFTQLEEDYKPGLERNQRLRDLADDGYDLWYEQNKNTASAEELAAKRAEHDQNALDRQQERATMAWAKYNALKDIDADAKETQEALDDAIKEQKELEELRNEQHTSLYTEADDAADKRMDLLEAEYNRDSALYERTGTNEQKRKREETYLKNRRDELKKKEENAQAQLDYLLNTEHLAETDQRVIDARKALVDAQKETAEIENQIAEKQLEEIELRLQDWENDHKKVEARMNTLAKVYGDGDLSARKDDYKNAVDTYGKDSDEARKAKYEGTTSAILAAVTAFKNLNYQMGYTKNLEEQLNATTSPEKRTELEQQIADSESAFLGFAENLADAFNMDAYGKRAVLKLANGVQKNRKKLAETWNKKVLPWLTTQNPQLVEAGSEMASIMGDAFGETWMEVGTECVSTLVSLMQGDWANALASGANLMLELAFNEKVQQGLMNFFQNETVQKNLLGGINAVWNALTNPQAQQKVLELFGELGVELKTLGLNFQNFGKVAIGALTGQAGGGMGIAASLGGIGAALGSIGTTLAAVFAEIWPFILAALAVIAVIAGIAWLVNQKGNDAGETLDKSVAEGVTDHKDKVMDSIQDMTDDAADAMAGMIATIRRRSGDEYEYTPCITPVVDLTNVEDSAAEVQSAFAQYDLSGDTSRALAAKVDAQAEIQNGARDQSNAQLLMAVTALGDRMDGVGESIRGMKLTIDGKRTIGYIDSELGARAARRMR